MSTDITLPRKSIDPDASVEERMTENAYERILPARYLYDGESQEEMYERVAENVASAEEEYDDGDHEKWSEKFERAMKELRWMPNSPTFFGAGTETKNLAACFVSVPQDDMEDILDTAKDAGIIFKGGGGNGYPFHTLRPKGDTVHGTDGKSSGPISFMQLFDTVCDTVKAGGKRRGAQMAIMRSDHPDIGRFAVSKRHEGDFSNFNISVGVTEDFEEKVREWVEIGRPVEDCPEYELINPRTDDVFEAAQETAHFYSVEHEDTSEDIAEENFWRDHAHLIDGIDKWRGHTEIEPGEDMTLPVGFIWEIIVDGAHKNGEPGLFNYHVVNDEHSFDVEKHENRRIEACNPCFTGDTKIFTSDGIKTVRELYERGTANEIVADSRFGGYEIEEATNVFKTGQKDVYELKTSEGYTTKVTADHEVMTERGWVEAQDLEPADDIHILDHEGEFGSHGSEELGRVAGWLVGDGHLKHSEGRAVLNLYEKDIELEELFIEDVNDVIRDPIYDRDYSVSATDIDRGDGAVQQKRITSERLFEVAEELGLTDEKLRVPEQFFTANKETVTSFISALFTADGTVGDYDGSRKTVRLASVSEHLLEEVQVLLSNLGIASKIYRERKEAGTNLLPNGKGGKSEYETQAYHELAIGRENIIKFRDKVGFLRSDKKKKLDELIESYERGPYSEDFTVQFESLEHVGEEEVFDITQHNTHHLINNGIVISNCGEEPLMDGDACNLGHINLSLLVEEDAPVYHDFNGDVKEYLDCAVDWEELDRLVELGVRFLDDVITESVYPTEDIEETVSNVRKIGLGIMGWAQMLIQLGIRYGSEKSFEAARYIEGHIKEQAIEESHKLAKQRGKFPAWDESKYANPTEYREWFEKQTGKSADGWEDGFPIRNYKSLTIAPTGTTSMLANTSGGCEPIYNVAFFKNVGNDIQGDDMLVEFDDYFLEVLEANGIDTDKVKREAEEKMRANEFDTVEDLDSVPDRIGRLFVTAGELTMEEHVLMQAAFQEEVDAGISKTINAPSSASTEDIGEAYLLALENDIKGITVYRDGSRDEQVKTTRVDNKVYSKQEKEELLDTVKQLAEDDEEFRDKLDESIKQEVIINE